MIQTSEGNLPQGLDTAIHTGLERGRRTVARRARVRRGAVRSALCLALVLGLFAGGVNASPAFAAAMEELPILGRLVQVFRVNAPSVDGGQTAAGSRAALTMEREGDTEWLTLRYEQSSAGRYHAEFASFPKTVTLTLPGTERVEILSELSRAQDTSQYIKSVYTAEGWVDRAAVVQLELESDADVQLREYQEPGSIVIRLTPAENRLDTIYSLRTLSADSPEALRSMAAPEEGARLLRDNAGRLFVELGQYDTREKAERAAGDRGAAGLIVERRTGNNVPVCYETEEAYQSAVLLDGYNELLQTTVEVEPILAFLEEHLAGASAEVQDTMLRGLTGFLDGNEAAGLGADRGLLCHGGTDAARKIPIKRRRNMRQRYLRLISALLLLAVLAACGTDREGAAGGTVEGVVNRNGDFLVLLTDEGEYQTFEFGAGVDTGALEEGDCVSVTYTGELGKEDSTPTAVSISKQ